MRVVIDNFDMTAQEMERLWDEQDKYINLLESQLRKSEKKVQMLRSQMFQNRLEVIRLKASLAWSSEELRQTLEKVGLDHNYSKTVQEAGPDKSDRKEIESQAVQRIANTKSTQTVLKVKSTKSTWIYSDDEIRKACLLMPTNKPAVC